MFSSHVEIDYDVISRSFLVPNESLTPYDINSPSDFSLNDKMNVRESDEVGGIERKFKVEMISFPPRSRFKFSDKTSLP